MPAKISAELKKALKYVMRERDPLTPYAAAKKVGIEPSTIYRSRLYIAWKANQELGKKGDKGG